ncbi:MAG: hypothetical protein C0429_09745 [Sphingopyxis sp.]|nr:hypothetical protein [Sphingopyxis sp.]
MKEPVLIKLITTDKTLLKWRSLPSKLDAIYAELDDIEGAAFTIDIEYRNVVPEVKDGRITHTWMDSLWSTFPEKRPDFLAFHMSNRQRKDWKITPSLRGAYQIDDWVDTVQEFYLWADEKTRRGSFNQFIQTFLHEFRHAFKAGTTQEDDTHELHADGDIRDTFKSLRMSDFNPTRRQQETIIDYLRRKIFGLRAQLSLYHPVQFTPRILSQPYGVRNGIYKRTGHHIGTDYPLPRQTPLYAPFDGAVTTAGSHPELGIYLHFEYTYRGKKYEERWCHLSQLPTIGAYRRGAKVALSGNTGLSTGPHLHREVWYNDVRTDLITKTNWRQLTLDPESLT